MATPTVHRRTVLRENSPSVYCWHAGASCRTVRLCTVFTRNSPCMYCRRLSSVEAAAAWTVRLCTEIVENSPSVYCRPPLVMPAGVMDPPVSGSEGSEKQSVNVLFSRETVRVCTEISENSPSVYCFRADVCMYASVCIRECIQKKPGKSPETLINKGKRKTFYLLYALYASFYRVSFPFLQSSIRE